VLKTTLQTPYPCDFNLTIGHQTFFRGRAGADLVVDGTYYRAIRRGPKVLAITAREAGPGQVEITLPLGGTSADLAFATKTMAHLLAFDIELSGFYEMLGRDHALSKVADMLRGLRPTRSETVFEALMIAIIGQQISSVVAQMIRDGIVETFGTPVIVDGYTLFAFPTPESLFNADPEALRAQKLSSRKVEYAQGAARRAAEGELEFDRFAALDDEEVIAELIKIRGVGRWTAEWVLIRALGRIDVLPAGDLALRRVVSNLYFEGATINETELADFGEKQWAPYRGLATTYLFSFLRQRRAAGQPNEPEAAPLLARGAGNT
jgi:DNA-3-methyladenine glycosylase II